MVVVVVEAVVSRHARDEEVATRMMRDEGGREERRGSGSGKMWVGSVWVFEQVKSKQLRGCASPKLTRPPRIWAWGPAAFFSSASLRYASASLPRPFSPRSSVTDDGEHGWRESANFLVLVGKLRARRIERVLLCVRTCGIWLGNIISTHCGAGGSHRGGPPMNPSPET